MIKFKGNTIEVAESIAFLASERASFITGTLLPGSVRIHFFIKLIKNKYITEFFSVRQLTEVVIPCAHVKIIIKYIEREFKILTNFFNTKPNHYEKYYP